MDTGDTILHGPTGETWIVAFANDREVCCVGWPCSLAKRSDCTLVRAAPASERDKLLRDMANMNGADIRRSYAKDRLARRLAERSK